MPGDALSPAGRISRGSFAPGVLSAGICVGSGNYYELYYYELLKLTRDISANCRDSEARKCLQAGDQRGLSGSWVISDYLVVELVRVVIKEIVEGTTVLKNFVTKFGKVKAYRFD